MLPDTSYHNHFSSPTDNHYLDFLVVTSLLDLGWEDLLEKGKTPVFWPGEFHGLYSPWGRKESDTTERLSLNFLAYLYGYIT